MNLMPIVKKFEMYEGFLKNKKLNVVTHNLDERLLFALQKFSLDENGTELQFEIGSRQSEAYQLDISENSIVIRADGCAGAFYAIQTLRQIYREDEIPCLHIEDWPDFSYRGFYHDITRGRISTVDTIKKLIEDMAYFKLNSLQLYVEHVFCFRENRNFWISSRCMTKEDIQEIDAYCKMHFIDFIPSLSTFGHMWEILEQKQYQHLRVLKNYEKKANFWEDRMSHHTIDPTEPESFELVRSLINQYVPCFTSESFNICCDETFDLKHLEQKGLDAGELYLGFVKKIVDHVHSLGKKVMMWGDILLQHPQVITEFPENVTFLNWYYDDDIEKMEEMIRGFAKFERNQIVCPGTSTWNRFCEDIDMEEINIVNMIELGYKYKAIGVLNTNWGDWGNPCCLELGMYGMMLGAAKAWTVDTTIDDSFHMAADDLLYGYSGAFALLHQVNRLNAQMSWCTFVRNYYYHRFHEGNGLELPSEEKVHQIQETYQNIQKQLEASAWENDIYRRELLIAAEAVCVMTELQAELSGHTILRLTNTSDWMKRYASSWRRSNHESELEYILEVFRYFEQI